MDKFIKNTSPLK